MMNHPFCWAFIGAGTLAKQVAKEITASGNHKIVCVYTRNPEKCAAFAAEYGALAAKSAEQAISAPEVEGVYIVTPHTSHFAYAKLALELGKSVLCEKPAAVTLADAKEMWDAAKACGRMLFPCQCMRWRSYMMKAKEIAEKKQQVEEKKEELEQQKAALEARLG